MKKPKSQNPGHKRHRKRRHGLTDEDVAVWRAVAETVDPLPGRDAALEAFDIPEATHARPRAVAPPAPRMDTAPPPRALPELSHDHQPGLDKATARRLKRGRAQIEGRIDLHGMTQDEARPALERFIEAAWMQGKREVLVITGKGTRADGTIGVLRQRVPHWLNQPPNRARVTAFTHAAPKDGGEGALYVRLKRRA